VQIETEINLINLDKLPSDITIELLKRSLHVLILKICQGTVVCHTSKYIFTLLNRHQRLNELVFSNFSTS